MVVLRPVSKLVSKPLDHFRINLKITSRYILLPSVSVFVCHRIWSLVCMCGVTWNLNNDEACCCCCCLNSLKRGTRRALIVSDIQTSASWCCWALLLAPQRPGLQPAVLRLQPALARVLGQEGLRGAGHRVVRGAGEHARQAAADHPRLGLPVRRQWVENRTVDAAATPPYVLTESARLGRQARSPHAA